MDEFYVDDNKPTYREADIVSRILAHIIDDTIILITMLIMFITIISNSQESNITKNMIIFYIAGMILILIYFTYLDFKGGTIGKKMMKIKIVTFNDQDPGLIRIIFRTFLFFTISPTGLIGLKFAHDDPEKKFFHDRLTATKVVTDATKHRF